MKKRVLSSHEDTLWRRVTKDVNKYSIAREQSDKTPSLTPPPAGALKGPARRAFVMGAAQKSTRNITTASSVVGAGDPAFDRRVNRRRLAIDETLDLHGLTAAAAEVALRAFLEMAARKQCRCVLVITGKGGGPSSRGVLHSRFSDWVNGENLKSLIARVAPAHQKHGGAGAWYVFLKKR